MKMYDLITKKGNTYRIDETNYKTIMAAIQNGKMFVMAGETPINVSNIAEIPKAKFTQVDIVKPNHRLKEGEKPVVDQNSPGYKSFKKAREALARKLSLRK